MPHAVIGIDLGTTNSALAWSEPRRPVTIFDVPQLVAPGEVSGRPTLPSFLYFTDQAQRDAGTVRLPWEATPDVVVGIFARDEGALVPARQVASAKSWLSNPRVDRTAALLPWGVDGGPRLSPVEASARVLAHLRDAWNHTFARTDEERRFDRRPIVLTVPASFDEEARELTMMAAKRAGITHVTLLEEPLAALYAWVAAHRRQLPDTFAEGALILVCDVGGGTTDFSLIRTLIDDGELAFERIAIGEHLLLGGDNFDLALAVLVEQKLAGSGRLTLTQRQVLRRKCTAAKEYLLTHSAAERAVITLLGSGRGVVGGGMSTELTRAEVAATLTEGFLPITVPDDVPARDRRVGLRELGLPYETEPAITRHLAAFLRRAGSAQGGVMARPDAVVFNGGFFSPALARAQVLDTLAAWFGVRPRVLDSAAPEAAVAVGAAFYGRLRQDPVAAKRLLIRAGSARSYYIGVDVEGAVASALCVMPRGTAEGTRFDLDRELSVVSNQPAAFTLYSSVDRTDLVGALVPLDEGRDLERHAPLVTAFRYGRRSRRMPLAVRLSAAFTETGTLELWCRAEETDHRWRLAFNLRAVEADPIDVALEDESSQSESAIVVAAGAVAAATAVIRAVFESGSASPPEALPGELETLVGHGKIAWPLPIIRAFADVLLNINAGRRISAAHEVRWLNLAGFCARPGFGSVLDEWRVSELRKVYAEGLAFPREVQNQVEWLVLWQRVAAGFSAGQQRELAQRMTGQLGLGQRRPSRINPQTEREAWRLLGSLERLDPSQRTRFGDELIERIRKEPRNGHWLWALSRLGARQPLYGPLNSVVPAHAAERWLERLLSVTELTAERAYAVAHIGARTGDPGRDVDEAVSAAAAERLSAAGFTDAAYQLREIVETSASETGRVFGEALPEGLMLGVPVR